MTSNSKRKTVLSKKKDSKISGKGYNSLTKLPEDISMLGSVLRKYDTLSDQLKNDYEDIASNVKGSQDSYKICIYHLDQLINWKMNFKKALFVVEFIESNFPKQLTQGSYFTAVFHMNKANLYAKSLKFYKEAIYFAEKADAFLNKSMYKSEIFRLNTILAQTYFEIDARQEALAALGKAQLLLPHIASMEYLTSYHFIAARINFEARHYKDCIHMIERAKEASFNTAFYSTHVDILFDCLKIEAFIELGEKEKATEAFRKVMDVYEKFFVGQDNLFAARILTVRAKLSILKYEIFSAADFAKESVKLFEQHDISTDTLYYIKALETACDACCLVGLEEDAKEICKKNIEQLMRFVLDPENSIRIQRAKAILKSLNF